MSRIPTPAVEPVTGVMTEVYAQIKQDARGVPGTFATIGVHSPKNS